MKRFIKSIFTFALLLIPTCFVYLFFWGFVPDKIKSNLNYGLGSGGYSYSRLQEVKNFKEVDILFLGSSRSYRGFDTRIFNQYGFYSFNLGSSSQTPLQTKVLLNRYLDRLNPKLIIYEVSPEIFYVDGVESALDIISNDKNDRESIDMALTINHIKVYNTLCYAIERDLLHLNVDFHQPLQDENDTYISGGYVERRQLDFSDNKDMADVEFVSNEKQTDAFHEIIRLFKRQGIDYLLVYTPVTDDYYENFPDNENFDDKMKTFGTYYNFNKILNLDDSLHFYDWDHLNQAGVEIFNRNLIEKIKPTQISCEKSTSGLPIQK
ncbi:MAG: hypothetical protein LBU22_11385 [Dysgonamonadaceae bacterium]|jgi:hypothetical protein|nr:hypothetical protein [Dysgonamonadaceae bacterium]